MEDDILYERKIGVAILHYHNITGNVFQNGDGMPSAGDNGIVSLYPFASISFYKNFLTIMAKKQKFLINYKNIQSFDKEFNRIRINHLEEDIPLYVYIYGAGNGLFLLQEIKKISLENNLNFKFNKLSLFQSIKNIFVP